VQSVVVTRHLTKVELTALNQGRDSISLPVFGNCQLNAGGATMGGDPFRSRWNESLPPGVPSHGTIVFSGRPAAGATTATLSFAHVFGFDPPSITVRDIRLNATG
jgi:hypothetical protein